MQKLFRSVFIILISLLHIYSSAMPAFAAEAIISSAQGYVAVQTLDQANQEDAALITDESLAGNDFFQQGPLSAPSNDEISGEMQTAREVYLLNHSENVSALSNDTYSGTSVMWGFSRVQAEQAWSLTRGAGTTIAVIDTGLDYNHEDIVGNVFVNSREILGDGIDNDLNGFIDDYRGWDFVNNDNNPYDDNGHGTHVSGIASAVEDNGKGIAGVAPDAKILAIKVLDASGSGAIDGVIKGIRYAADLGAKVINMSLGIAKRYLSTVLLNAFQDAVNYATGKGSVVIVAAGNENVDSSTTAPAGLANTVAVGATDSSNRKASFSNTRPDLAAPGVTIASLMAGGGYVYMSGTSMASPFVAGAAALIMSYHGSTYSRLGYSGQQIYNDVLKRLTLSAVDLGKRGYDAGFGYGLLNVYAALTYNSFGTASPKTAQSFSTTGTGQGSASFSARSFSVSGIGMSASSSAAHFLAAGNWYEIASLKRNSKSKKKR